MTSDRSVPATFALDALSPVDGRYAEQCAELRALFSEAALIRHRLRIEAEWFLFLAEELRLPELAQLDPAVIAAAGTLARGAGSGEAAAVKNEERRIAHDVKAVEYYVRARLRAAGARPAELELVHFGCTSEDINNLAYALMLKTARETVMLPATGRIHEWLTEAAHAHAALAMLSRTHGQAASPTTLGKELANVAARIARASAAFAAVEVLGKINGAVGNWNAHVIAYPAIDWRAASARFVARLGLAWNEYTVQIEPHDWIAAYCDALARLNTILIDFARDTWGYLSLGYFRQRAVAGEVGSSTMPHKVNPIEFENAEGNLGVANALLRHFADKLPVSRWQRDLSDSTVLRNLGPALAHALLAFKSIERGLARLEPDAARMAADLDASWEVLGEAVQTVMRRYGLPNAYERLKDLTRGRPLDAAALRAFVASLPLPAEERARLSRLTPADYVGLARELARDA
jgi:adenylosuccinate lyase